MPLKILEEALKADIKPALGCTEPVTIALAACHAFRQIKGKMQTLEIIVSTNLFKNAMEVGIPGTGGRSGIQLAAALGSLAPKETPDLTLLDGISTEWLEQADQLVAEGKVKLSLANKIRGLMVEATVTTENGTARAIIKNSHENLVLLEKNGTKVIEKAEIANKPVDKILSLREKLAKQDFSKIWNNIEELSEDTRAHLLKGIEMNLRVSSAGMAEEGSLHIGSVYNDLIEKGWLGNDITNRAKAITSSAVDARMSGCSLPVMTSAGSGNQGLSITLPMHVLAKHLKSNDRKLAEALAISHSITSILKFHTGTLSAMCGCVVCSGIGLTAGITYLLGGSLDEATAAVNNMVGSITGIICDGAKVGCAIKLVCAVDSAFQAAFMAKRGLKLPVSNGVLGDTLGSSLANIGRIAAPGMIETDDQILSIMLGKPQ